MKMKAAGITALCVGLLAGCSSWDANSGGSGNTPKPGGPVSNAVPAGVEQIPDMGTDFAGIRKDVNVPDCTTAAGKHTVKGTVKNSASEAKDVMVAIAWMSKDQSQVFALKVFTKKAMAAGASEDFAFDVNLPQGVETCGIQGKSNKVGTLK